MDDLEDLIFHYSKLVSRGRSTKGSPVLLLLILILLNIFVAVREFGRVLVTLVASVQNDQVFSESRPILDVIKVFLVLNCKAILCCQSSCSKNDFKAGPWEYLPDVSQGSFVKPAITLPY